MEHIVELTEAEIAAVSGGWGGEYAMVMASNTNVATLTPIAVSVNNTNTAHGPSAVGNVNAIANNWNFMNVSTFV